MKTTYETRSALKFAEEDIYKEGCIPETATSFEVDVKFSSDSVAGVLDKIKKCYDVLDNDIILNSCDEEGRIDVCILEDGNSYKATPADIKEWKKGKKVLYSAIYSYQIEKVTRESVIL